MRMLIDTSLTDEMITVISDGNSIKNIYYDAGICKKGDVYAATIAYLDKSLNVVFVNFGHDRNGFLPLDNIHPIYFHYRERDLNNLHLNQLIMIQIEKEEHGTKGAYCTTYLSLLGRYCVLMTDNKTQSMMGISKRIDDCDIRKNLSELLAQIELPEDIGIILRSAAIDATNDDILLDLEYLFDTLYRLKHTKLKQRGLIYSEARGIVKALRDYGTKDITQIRVTDNVKEAKNIAKIFYKNVQVDLCDENELKLLSNDDFDQVLTDLAKERVQLKSGGYLYITPTEALTAIDVNSGKRTDNKTKHKDNNMDHKANYKDNNADLIFNTNKEAAIAACEQILLRNISGQIVIDFIEMDNSDKNEEIERIIKNAFKLDRARIKIGKLSQFSMLEISRQRTGASVYDWLLQRCEYCICAGYRYNDIFFAHKHIRTLIHQAKSKANQGYTICVMTINAKILECIMNKCMDYIQNIRNKYKIDLKLYSNNIEIKKCHIQWYK